MIHKQHCITDGACLATYNIIQIAIIVTTEIPYTKKEVFFLCDNSQSLPPIILHEGTDGWDEIGI